MSCVQVIKLTKNPKRITKCDQAHVDDLLPACLDVLDDVVDGGLDAAAGKQRVEGRLRERRQATPEKYGAENDRKFLHFYI